MVEIDPTNNPAITPSRLTRFHQSVNNNAGPKDAPKPLHAYDTIPKTKSFVRHAIIKAINPINNVNILLHVNFVSPPYVATLGANKSSVITEVLTNNCESAVDIIAAMAPEINIPANHAGSKEVAMIGIIFSGSGN